MRHGSVAALLDLTSVDDESTPARARHVPGEPGLWLLLFGDLTIFSILFAAYLIRLNHNKLEFAVAQERLERGFGVINGLVLLTSSILIVFASRAMRRDDQRHLAGRLTIAGAAVGASFVVIKAVEYYRMISSGLTPSAGDFYMWFFVLTGLHLAHVILGLVILTVLSVFARQAEPSSIRITLFEAGGCFWHMVDLLWILIFSLLFLVR
jgi:nitric oxide reductase NorE protein